MERHNDPCNYGDADLCACSRCGSSAVMKERALELYAAGAAIKLILAQCEIAPATLTRWVRASGLPMRVPNRRKPVSPDMKLEAIQRYARGEQPKRIVADLPICRSQISRWVRDAGVPMQDNPTTTEAARANAR